ncbi:hypothetical protein ACFYP6_39470 [Streptomyces goshikiensis]|uniref:hypothetical protein n=1 Tax=Streptomyces goshikiensis TaxID=1942 RepID=UPI0036A50AB1
MFDDVPVGVGEVGAGGVTQRFVGPIVSGQAQQRFLLAALSGFGAMSAGHGFAVVDIGVALLKEPLDAGLRESLHRDVIQPRIVASGRVIQSDLRLEMAVLQGGGNEAAGAAHDEAGEGAAEARARAGA